MHVFYMYLLLLTFVYVPTVSVLIPNHGESEDETCGSASIPRQSKYLQGYILCDFGKQMT